MPDAITRDGLHLLGSRLWRLRTQKQRLIGQLMSECELIESVQEVPARASQAEEIPEPRRPHIKPVVGCTKQECQFVASEVGMTECQGVSVEFLKVCFADQRLHL